MPDLAYMNFGSNKIKGNVKTAGFEDQIAIRDVSYSIQVGSDSTILSGDFNFSKERDIATVPLLLRAGKPEKPDGKPGDTVIITLVTTEGTTVKAKATYTLEGCDFTYASTLLGSEIDGETYTLSCTKFTVKDNITNNTASYSRDTATAGT